MAHRLTLPPQLSYAHNVLHISMLRKYEPDHTDVLDYQWINLRKDMTYIK